MHSPTFTAKAGTWGHKSIFIGEAGDSSNRLFAIELSRKSPSHCYAALRISMPPPRPRPVIKRTIQVSRIAPPIATRMV
jgi:hypothetical protein